MKNRRERGAATLLVIGICLFAIIFLMTFVGNMENKRQAQDKEMNQIQKRYSVDNTEMEEIYARIVNE